MPNAVTSLVIVLDVIVLFPSLYNFYPFECHVFFLESAKRYLKKRLHRSFSDVAHRNDCLTLQCCYLRWGTIWVYERIQLNRSFIGRSSRNLKNIIVPEFIFSYFFFRLEFIVHLKETLSWLCVSGMWSSKGNTTEAQLKTKV